MPAAVPVGWNLTGIVLPILYVELPSLLRGARTFDHGTLTFTLNVWTPLELPALSVAVQLTCVVPSANVLPEAGVQAAVTVASTASLAVGRKVAGAPAAEVAVRLMSGNLPSAGAVLSRTDTVKSAEDRLPALSDEPQVT